jgi:hypothetical protein
MADARSSSFDFMRIFVRTLREPTQQQGGSAVSKASRRSVE